MIEVLFDGVVAPAQANPADAGYDLKAVASASIPPGCRMLIKTGLRIAIPNGYVGMVCSRSGLALKQGVFVINAPGIVDAPYRGEVGVILCNLGDRHFDVAVGDRVAQLLFVKVEHPAIVRGILDNTSRGEGGFGSSGK